MKTRTFSPLAAAVFFLLPVHTLLADAVYTSDGSKLVGKVTQWNGDKLVIETAVAGILEVDGSLIVGVETDEPVVVQFASGDRLIGTVELSDDGKSSVIHAAIGDITVASNQIAAIWQPGADSPEVIAIKQQAEETRKALTPTWTVALEAGGSRREGNTNTREARGRLDVVRKTKNDLLSFYLSANFAEQDNRRSENEYRGGILYENNFTERSFWFTRLEMEFDEFENLDLRSTAAAGVGHYWIRKPDHMFKTRLGLGYRHEAFNNNITNNEAILDLGYDWRVDVAPWVQFTHSLTYSPNFEQTNDYRLNVDSALLFPFKHDNLKLKLGIRNEYNSMPQPGIDRLDNMYYINIVLQLVTPKA